jgi:hypothetical protein
MLHLKMFHVEHLHPRHGQSLVEFILFVTILFVMLAGVLDLGALLDAHLAVTYAARQGALSAAAAGSAAAADCDALGAVAAAMGTHAGLVVTRISIYQPGSDGLPLGGLGGSAYADVYAGDPGCASVAGAPPAQAMNWPPANRAPAFTPPAMLGVEIDYAYTWQTPLIATGTLSVVDHVVVPLTPG